jgi:hypothetical protein
MKKILLVLLATVFLSSLSAYAQEAPTSCCSEKKAEQAACAEKTPAQKEACADKSAEGASSCCADKAVKRAEGSTSCCADKGAKPAEGAKSCCADMASMPAEGAKSCCGACQEGANNPQVVKGYRIQRGGVHHGEAPMHRMHRMEEGTEMSVDTIISGDSTKVIVRVMKRANLAEGQMEDVMIHLDGLGLPEGALSGEPHVFMFKSEAMGGPDMVWNEAAPGAGNAFFMASNKAILGVKLEKRDDIQGAFVVEVIPTSTAAVLGLKTGDIIVAVDGKTVFSEESMMAEMAPKFTGDPIEITYRRDGKKKKVSGFLIPASPAMGLPMGGMMRGMPGMRGEDLEIMTGGIPEARIYDSSAQNVEITEEIGENGEKRVKVIVIKKDGN